MLNKHFRICKGKLKSIPSARILLAVVMLAAPFRLSADTLFVESPKYQIDVNKRLIIVSEPVETLNQRYPEPKTGILLDRYYTFSQPQGTLETGIAYPAASPNNSVYTLYFSRIPVVVINTPHQIKDEPRVYIDFTLIEPGGQVLRSHGGAEIRGGLSQSFPKLSLRLEFWQDTEGTETRDLRLLGMRSDDDWNLQAMYNEPLRLRSKTSNQLWQQMHRLYYQNKEPGAVNGITMEYVEFFLNGSYRGIYALGERVDRKQLQLEQFDGTMRGELYKGVDWGVTTFHEMPEVPTAEPFWDGFEYDYPEEIVDWTNFFGLADFIINETDYYFYTDFPGIFDLRNAVDYFIFLNVLRASDNTGKNLYIARYDSGEPYFFVPWDLDGVLGNMYLGIREPVTDGLLSNGLFDRLLKDCRPSGFRQELRSRWNSLRQDVITTSNIMQLVQENFNLLKSNGIYEREAMTWDDYVYNEDDLSYLESWLTGRLAHLDEAFNSPCQGVTLTEPDEERIGLYPNPVRDNLVVKINGGLLPFEFRVYNSSGQPVVVKTIKNRLNDVNFSQLPAGLYFVVLQNAYYREVNKIIVSP